MQIKKSNEFFQVSLPFFCSLSSVLIQMYDSFFLSLKIILFLEL